MTENWQPIESAPKDGSQFLATDGILLGVGYHYRREEPLTIRDATAWRQYYDRVMAEADRPGMGIVERGHARHEAWEAAKSEAPPQPEIANPKAGQVGEWDCASAFYAFDGKTETETYDGPVGFTPTHWMPLPDAPASAIEAATAAGTAQTGPAEGESATAESGDAQ